MRTVFRALLSFPRALLGIGITVLVGTAASLGLPAYLSRIINIGIATADMALIVRTGGIMLLLVLAGGLAMGATGFFAARVSMGVGRILRARVFTHVQYFSQAEMHRFSTASLITRTNNDITQVQNFINVFLRVILMAPIMAVGGVWLSYQKSPAMSMVLLISLPLLLLAVLLIARRALPLSTAVQQKIDTINLVMREKLTGVRVIRAFGTEPQERARFATASCDYMKNAIALQRVTGLLTPVLSFVLYATTVALLYIGALQLLQGQTLPVGDIIAVIQYVMQIMMSVMMLAMVSILYPRAAVSAARIAEVLDTPASITSPTRPRNCTAKEHSVVFEQVSFSYPQASQPALTNISFTAKAGQTTAIIGATGSGKSTLLSLIARFYDVTQGSVLVDGIDVRAYDLQVLRAKLGYVAQKAFLFRGSIASNISFGAPQLTQQQLAHAAHVAQAEDFIMQKPEGFDSAIAQAGANVSGGQKQRLSIARALARQPAIYLFDDSFSALDGKTDAALRQALIAETRTAIVLLVAQRVSSIAHADQIIVLDKGTCVGVGTHTSLLRTCAVYQEIVSSQQKEGA